jgi:hypothetical protein
MGTFQGADFYVFSGGSSRAFDGDRVTAGYSASMLFYTGGSLIDGGAGFAFHRTREGGFGYKISSPAGFLLRRILIYLFRFCQRTYV